MAEVLGPGLGLESSDSGLLISHFPLYTSSRTFLSMGQAEEFCSWSADHPSSDTLTGWNRNTWDAVKDFQSSPPERDIPSIRPKTAGFHQDL